MTPHFTGVERAHVEPTPSLKVTMHIPSETLTAILDEQTCQRLRALAPEILLHGTRFMSAILHDDELGAPLHGDYMVHFANDPQVAASAADAGPHDCDEGRGGIIVLDRSKLAARFILQPAEESETWWDQGERVSGPVTQLSEFIVGTFWLDELVPGKGLYPPRPLTTRPFPPAVSFASLERDIRGLRTPWEGPDVEFDAHYWGITERIEIWAGMR
jgi:hypothetical protein